MRRHFLVEADNAVIGNARPLPAIHPGYAAPVLRMSDNGRRELVEMNWGFLTPNYSKRDGSPIRPRTWNNARDDKLLSSELWRSSFHYRRCLIPATGYCETKGRKPAEFHWFGMQADNPDMRPLFALAGMWRMESEMLHGSGESGLRHTMVTTNANELARPIHAKGRMPAIVSPDDYETWLSGTVDRALRLLKPFPSSEMRITLHGFDQREDPAFS